MRTELKLQLQYADINPPKPNRLPQEGALKCIGLISLEKYPEAPPVLGFLALAVSCSVPCHILQLRRFNMVNHTD